MISRAATGTLPGMILRQKRQRAVVRRIAVAQTLYACGSVLCFLNTYDAIAAIALVEVNYAIAPKFGGGLFSKRIKGSEQET